MPHTACPTPETSDQKPETKKTYLRRSKSTTMRYIAFYLLLAALVFSCGNRESTSSASTTELAAETPVVTETEEDAFLPNLPALELSYFQPNKDGSGMAGIPKPQKVEKPPKGKLISYQYFKAHVIPRADGPGEDINVYQPTGGLAYVGGGEAVYYAGIYNQYLLLDVGTGASLREIMVINMVEGDTAYRADYHGDYAAMYGQYLVHLSPDPSGEACSAKGNLPGKMHRAVWMNMATGKTKYSPQKECLYVE